MQRYVISYSADRINVINFSVVELSTLRKILTTDYGLQRVVS